MSNIVQNLARPLTVGAVATLASFALGYQGQVLGMPAPVAWGLVAAGSSAIQEVSREYVLKKITDDPASSSVAQFVSPALTGASMVAVISALDLAGGNSPNMDILFGGFLIGAVSEVAGGYAQKAIVQPVLQATNMASVDSLVSF